MNIKKMVFGGITLFLFSIFFVFFAYYSYHNRLIRVKEFRGIKEGHFAPGFSATSDNGTHFTSTTPSGNFFVYFINEENPGIIQFDHENGPKGDIVLKNGGHMIADADVKTLVAFKINFHTEKKWWKKITTFRKPPQPKDLIDRFDASIMVVTDRNAKIMGIYTNVKWRHLKRILSELQLLK